MNYELICTICQLILFSVWIFVSQLPKYPQVLFQHVAKVGCTGRVQLAGTSVLHIEEDILRRVGCLLSNFPAMMENGKPRKPSFFPVSHEKNTAGDFPWNTGWLLVILNLLIYIHRTWNSKQPFINGSFNWMIPIFYMENGCFTKHP